MSRRLHAAIVSLAALAAFVCATLLAQAFLAGVRIDATQGRLYSLSPGTRALVAGLEEPVVLTLYVSQAAADQAPAVRAHAARARALLRAYASASGGRIRLALRDTAPFSEAEDEAIAAGLQSVALFDGGDPLYLGLVARAAGGETALAPFLAPDQDAALEYDISALIARLARPERPRVAVLTSLPWLLPGGGEAPGALVMQDLERAADVEPVTPAFAAPPEADVLMIAHPPPLGPAQIGAIEAFLARGGRALILLDPAAVTDERPGEAGPSSSVDRSGPLLSALGVRVSAQVVIDQQNALPVTREEGGRTRILAQPLYWSAGPENLSRSDLATQALARGLHLGAPGAITLRPAAGVTFEPLARSSTRAALSPATDARDGADPALFQAIAPDGVNHVVAARLTGPDGRVVVLVSDADMLNDGFYRDETGVPIADNAAFLLNVLDQLAGDPALVDLRSRAPAARPLTVVEERRQAAEARFLDEQERLEAALARTLERLAALDAPAGPGAGALSGPQRAEIARFREEAASIRARLRAIEEEYRRAVSGIEALLSAIQIGLVPLSVAFLGFWRPWMRRPWARRIGR
jgi:ABC-2 type transport system permease protein